LQGRSQGNGFQAAQECRSRTAAGGMVVTAAPAIHLEAVAMAVAAAGVVAAAEVVEVMMMTAAGASCSSASDSLS